MLYVTVAVSMADRIRKFKLETSIRFILLANGTSVPRITL